MTAMAVSVQLFLLKDEVSPPDKYQCAHCAGPTGARPITLGMVLHPAGESRTPAHSDVVGPPCLLCPPCFQLWAREVTEVAECLREDRYAEALQRASGQIRAG